jgi:hypothetical protein
MCIISDPVNRVAATKLFAMPSRDGKRQLTVYTNTVDTVATNVMCLPVPAPATVAFEKVPKDLFKQCSNSIQVVRKEPSWSYSLMPSASKSRPHLAVQSHGSYEVVLVPSMDELDRVPPSFATLTPQVIEFLRSNYPAGFGVILCRLCAGVATYEPFAYSHALESDRLFLPTKHYHSHDTIGNADWDHEIYTMQTDAKQAHNVGPKKVPKYNNEIKWDEMPAEFRAGSSYEVHLFEREGSAHRNEDLQFPLRQTWLASIRKSV